MLKTDLHLHCNEDPDDHTFITYTAKQLINHMAAQHFDVISITCHNKVIHTKKLVHYAKQQGILLIPGIEKTIEGKHILINNITQQQANKIHTFADLRKHKTKHMLVTAPHPFYPAAHALNDKLMKNINVFDSIEYSHFYPSFCNLFNKHATRYAQENHLPIIGTSDAHWLKQTNYTYTLINAKKNTRAIINAIKQGKVELRTQPLPLRHLCAITTHRLLHHLRDLLTF